MADVRFVRYETDDLVKPQKIMFFVYTPADIDVFEGMKDMSGTFYSFSRRFENFIYKDELLGKDGSRDEEQQLAVQFGFWLDYIDNPHEAYWCIASNEGAWGKIKKAGYWVPHKVYELLSREALEEQLKEDLRDFNDLWMKKVYDVTIYIASVKADEYNRTIADIDRYETFLTMKRVDRPIYRNKIYEFEDKMLANFRVK